MKDCRRTLTRIYLEGFTAFERLELELNAGINVFVGSNGTGKTHLLKVAYTACELSRESPETMTETYVHDKLARVFRPSGDSVGRLIRYPTENPNAIMEVCQAERKIRISIFVKAKDFRPVDEVGWCGKTIPSVFIPSKEMLSNGPGFRSLYAYREIHFEEVYNDILERAYLPPLRKPLDDARQLALKDLENALGGRIVIENEEFFLKNEDSDVEFSLLAEGMRKLGLLWLLVRNGTLPDGSVLCWDEPEASLNPQLVSVVIKVLLQLQRQGVQILLATHDYAILKELELLMEENDDVRFHALYHTNGEVKCESAAHPFELAHSPIAEAFTALYNREIERSLGADDYP
jgi:energy-coupling factor transporter ATP-binding protein EcfA2